MKKTIKLAMASLLAIGLFVGCSGDAGTDKPVSVVTSGNVEINTSVTDTPVAIGESGAEIQIAEGTTFINSAGDAVDAPKIEATVEATAEKTSTTIDLGGVRPTEPMIISVPAPSNSKEGETVSIDAPEGSKSLSKKVNARVVKVGRKLIVRVLILAEAFATKITLTVTQLDTQLDTSTD